MFNYELVTKFTHKKVQRVSRLVWMVKFIRSPSCNKFENFRPTLGRRFVPRMYWWNEAYYRWAESRQGTPRSLPARRIRGPRRNRCSIFHTIQWPSSRGELPFAYWKRIILLFRVTFKGNLILSNLNDTLIGITSPRWRGTGFWWDFAYLLRVSAQKMRRYLVDIRSGSQRLSNASPTNAMKSMLDSSL